MLRLVCNNSHHLLFSVPKRGDGNTGGKVNVLAVLEALEVRNFSAREHHVETHVRGHRVWLDDVVDVLSGV